MTRIARVLATPSPWLLDLLAVTVSAWLAFFILHDALSRVPPEYWRNRDDGVITLSHAKNLVDFGFVGVNPSGERVEGYSSPLQFVIFAIVYAVSHVGYHTFIAGQTAIGWLALGAVSYAVLFLVGRVRILAVVGTVGVSLLLGRIPSFLEWGASGLENPECHVLYVASAAAILHLSEEHRPSLAWAPLFVVAMYARAESILHIAPLLCLFGLRHRAQHRDFSAARLVAIVGALWLLILSRAVLVFHDFVPNTAHAQGLHPGERILDALAGNIPRATLDLGVLMVRSNTSILLLLLVPILVLARRTRPLNLLTEMGVLMALLSWCRPSSSASPALKPRGQRHSLRPLPP